MKKTIIILLSLFCGSLFAAIINVPQDYFTIQDGIDFANSGDTVQIDMGIFSPSTNGESFPINIASGIHIIGAGEELTILDAEQTGGVLYFENIIGSSISDLTIQNGYVEQGDYNNESKGGGIYCKYSSPSMTNLTITNNFSYAGGGGIYCRYSSPSMRNLTITNNSSFFYGGGLSIVSSDPTLENVVISNNNVNYNYSSNDGGAGGGMYCIYSSPDLENVEINNNFAHIGGGIRCEYDCNMSLENVTIMNNSAEDGGGISIFAETSNPTFNNVVISNNSALYSGGGIKCAFSSPILKNVRITNNLVIDESSWGINKGGGLSCWLCSPTLTNVTIADNSAKEGAGINLEYDSNPNFFGVTITNNLAIEGGGIRCRNSNPNILNTIIWNNSPEEIYFDDDGNTDSILISYSNLQGGEEGIITNDNDEVHWLDGNIDADPLFTDSENGDYSLQPNSPCIDAGTPLFVLGGDTLVNMAPDEYYGSSPDMGAVEYNPLFIAEDLPVLPVEFTLYPAYPNPFNPVTTISFSVPMVEKLSKTSLLVYDIKGKQVETLLNDAVAPGFYSIEWNAETIPSGIYFVKLSSGGFSKSQKLMLLK